jgi:hypothetical protein
MLLWGLKSTYSSDEIPENLYVYPALVFYRPGRKRSTQVLLMLLG